MSNLIENDKYWAQYWHSYDNYSSFKFYDVYLNLDKIIYLLTYILFSKNNKLKKIKRLKELNKQNINNLEHFFIGKNHEFHTLLSQGQF